MCKVIVRSFGTFPILATLYLTNGSSWSEIDQNLNPKATYLVYTRYFWLLSVQGQSVVIQCISEFWQGDVVTSATLLLN